MKKLSLRQRRRNLLAETVNHFNSENRSVKPDSLTCLYYGGPNKGCAIGRKIKDKELCKLLDAGVGASAVANVFSQLPIALQELGCDFLGKIQGLHDTKEFWEKNGINKLGMAKVREIRKQFKL